MSCESDSEFVNVDKWVSEDDAVDPARLACPFVRGRASGRAASPLESAFVLSGLVARQRNTQGRQVSGTFQQQTQARYTG